MIHQIEGVPQNIAAFRAEGEVTAKDFDTLIEKVETIVTNTGKLNYLLLLDTAPANFTAGAWLKDAFLGINNLTKWNRAAIVSDSDNVREFTDAFSKIMPGEFRGFRKEDMQHAIDWTSEKIDI
ncbi:MAG TPA: STAS/SEC14 domain-containing protein [Flavobacterium sp.]|jgi:hypothetical protein